MNGGKISPRNRQQILIIRDTVIIVIPVFTVKNAVPVAIDIKSVRFDENYRPAESTRTTTNFANLARGERCQENLRNALTMIDNRFNTLAHWDNPKADRYAVELEIITGELSVAAEGATFPAIEMLKTTIIDRHLDKRIEGMTGNNFSSYVRDYDFSVWLSEHNKERSEFGIP